MTIVKKSNNLKLYTFFNGSIKENNINLDNINFLIIKQTNKLLFGFNSGYRKF
jgi:hypothetical protein